MLYIKCIIWLIKLAGLMSLTWRVEGMQDKIKRAMWRVVVWAKYMYIAIILYPPPPELMQLVNKLIM